MKKKKKDPSDLPNTVPSLPNIPPFAFPLLVGSSSSRPALEPGPPLCLDSRIMPLNMRPIDRRKGVVEGVEDLGLSREDEAEGRGEVRDEGEVLASVEEEMDEEAVWWSVGVVLYPGRSIQRGRRSQQKGRRKGTEEGRCW